MVRYVDLDKIVAKIERRRDSNAKDRYFGRLVEDNYFLDFINTLEVKEGDLDKEIDLVEDKYHGFYSLSRADIIDVANHFFELGLRSTITEKDCKLIWNIGDDLPYMSEEEFFKELLRRYKAQKGEKV